MGADQDECFESRGLQQTPVWGGRGESETSHGVL